MTKPMLCIFSALTGAAAVAYAAVKISMNRETEIQSISNKHLDLFLMMNKWVKVKQEGKNLASYFEKRGFKKIAVYGMSYAGETLIDELKPTDITVVYGIDKNADSIYMDLNIVSLGDNLETVDAVVVTSITFFDEVKKQLSEKINCPIISLEDILYEV